MIFNYLKVIYLIIFQDKLIEAEIIEMSTIPDESSDATSSEGVGNNETVIKASTPTFKKNLTAVYHPPSAILNFPRRK
jgi:hypothetical protein